MMSRHTTVALVFAVISLGLFWLCWGVVSWRTFAVYFGALLLGLWAYRFGVPKAPWLPYVLMFASMLLVGWESANVQPRTMDVFFWVGGIVVGSNLGVAWKAVRPAVRDSSAPSAAKSAAQQGDGLEAALRGPMSRESGGSWSISRGGLVVEIEGRTPDRLVVHRGSPAGRGMTWEVLQIDGGDVVLGGTVEVPIAGARGAMPSSIVVDRDVASAVARAFERGGDAIAPGYHWLSGNVAEGTRSRA